MSKRYLLILFSMVISVSNFLLVFYLLDSKVCVRNSGVAFGFDLSFLGVILVLLLLLLLVVFIKSKDVLRYNVLAITVLGVGNFVERLINGYICDYINILNIYVNLNDIAITVLVIFSLISLLKNIYADKSRRRNKSEVG